MAKVTVHRTIDAPASQVWDHLSDLASHVAWMDDAVAIRFTSSRHQGVGTTFECDTRIGPLRTVDVMKVTRWRPGKAIGVDHVGLVRGAGELSIQPRRRGRCTVTWTERLRFPLYFGGPLGAFVASKTVLRRVWRRNLRNLARIIEGR